MTKEAVAAGVLVLVAIAMATTGGTGVWVLPADVDVVDDSCPTGEDGPSTSSAAPPYTVAPVPVAAILLPQPTHHVLYADAVNGSDANTGRTVAASFKTLTRALTVAAGLRSASPLSTIQLNVAVGVYDGVNGEIFPLVVPHGVTVEADEGPGPIPTRTAPDDGTYVRGNGTTFEPAVFVLQPGPRGSLLRTTLRGFDISGGGTGVYVYATASADGNLLDASALIENNKIHANDSRILYTPEMPVRVFGGVALGIGVISVSARSALAAPRVRHNHIFENGQVPTSQTFVGTGIVIDAQSEDGSPVPSRNETVVYGNCIRHQEVGVWCLTSTLAYPGACDPRILTNLVYFHEFNVLLRGYARGAFLHNTIAKAVPWSSVGTVFGMKIEDQADPSRLQSNIIFNPDGMHPMFGAYVGHDIDVPDAVGFVARHTIPNAHRNGVWGPAATSGLLPPTWLHFSTDGGIEFRQGTINWTMSGGGLDLHLRGYRSPSPTDRANVRLVDTATFADLLPAGVFEMATDVDSDPRIARYYEGTLHLPDFGADEVSAARLVFDDVSTPFVNPPSFAGVFIEQPFKVDPQRMYFGLFTRFEIDANHPLAYSLANAPVQVIARGEGNIVAPGSPLLGNFLLSEALVFIANARFGFIVPGNPALIESDLRVQGALIDAQGRLWLTNRLRFEINDAR